MTRTQVYLTKEEEKGLKALALRSGKRQSELIREAVDALIVLSGADQRSDILRRARGLWRNSKLLDNPAAARQSLNRRLNG